GVVADEMPLVPCFTIPGGVMIILVPAWKVDGGNIQLALRIRRCSPGGGILGARLAGPHQRDDHRSADPDQAGGTCHRQAGKRLIHGCMRSPSWRAAAASDTRVSGTRVSSGPISLGRTPPKSITSLSTTIPGSTIHSLRVWRPGRSMV